MKTITIKISDKALAELQNHINIKCATGEVYGMIDAVVIRIIRSINDEKSEVDIRVKGEKNNDIV